MELLAYQQPYFDVLMGLPDDKTKRHGARRAWIDLPAGYGKTHVTGAALNNLHQEVGGALFALYVTQRAAFGQVQRLAGAVPCREFDPKGDVYAGLTLCSQQMLCRHHDTAIEYSNCDLIVVDLGFNPLFGQGGKTLAAAMQTLLRASKRLWIIGGGA